MTEHREAGSKRVAMRAEQAHLGAVHDRVDELRATSAARAAEAEADRSGSTFQARYERDVTAHHHAARAARYTFGDLEQLVFGRLDLGDGDAFHVGRVSVIADDGDVLLVDWRAPVAAAFYQATAAEPRGVARRRTLTAEGPRLKDLDDELLDVEAADRLGLEAVTGQGSLLAALQRTRTGHMRDIVATIQADQDRIIRLPASGTVVVTGGPGTGKTVVALHRVAYLLYTNRERFEGRGVLVVGPSNAFTDYISRVLPGLGEEAAVLRSLAGFAGHGVPVEGWDAPEVAAVKGDLRMADVLRELVLAALPPLPPETRVSFDGTTAIATARELGQVRDRLLGRVRPEDGGRYHERAGAAEDALRAALWRAWRAARRAGGQAVPEDRVSAGFDSAVADAAQTVLLRRCFWPELDALDVLQGAIEDPARVRAAAAGVLRDDEVDLLVASWARRRALSVDDVALLDEARALLGRATSAGSRGDRDGGLGADASPMLSAALGPVLERADVDDPDYADFAHVVVDEAQDLTPMQWRMVARRGPYASWTVVGDLAQRSRVAEPRSWDEIARLIGRRQVQVTGLTVNYRTPTEIVALARAVLEAAGHDPDAAPTSVRETGEPPVLVRAAAVADAVADLAVAAASAREGTVAVVAPLVLVDDAERALADALGGLDEPARTELTGRIRVLDPRTVKGLEFDDVLVAAPDLIASESAVGLHQLYVAVTRATRSLTLVAAPDAVVPGASACVERGVTPPRSASA
ncbi:MAG: HelD family protein [Actinomycetes bacterium]